MNPSATSMTVNRGVKTLVTSRRRRVWSGGSIDSSDGGSMGCSSRDSARQGNFGSTPGFSRRAISR